MRSLRTRLITVAAIWVVAGVAIAGFLLSGEFKGFLAEQFYHELNEHLDELEGIAEIDDGGNIVMQRALSDPRYSMPLSGFYWEVQRNGAVAARSNSLEGPMLKVPVDGESDAQVHNHNIAGPTGELLIAERQRWMGGDKQPTRIIIGTDRRLLDDVLSQFNSVLLWSLGLFSLSMIAVTGLLLAYAMAPIAHLRAAFTNYRSGVTADMRGEFPDEVQPLIDDLNGLLAASAEQIQRARAQAGNIAHGLKTPLAILADEGHRLRLKGDEQSAAVLTEQCRRMQGQIDYQIARARTAASRAKPGTAASLTDLAVAVVAALTRLHADRGLRIDNAISAGVTVACESQDLHEILGNLIDNACKHAKSAVRVRLNDGAALGFVGIVVEDDGPGLPPEAWEVVFNVGERWSNDETGSGLGLAIVRDLVHLYGGKISLGRSDIGGLKVQFELPEYSRRTSSGGTAGL
jgi:signal transduction histidine kinase